MKQGNKILFAIKLLASSCAWCAVVVGAEPASTTSPTPASASTTARLNTAAQILMSTALQVFGSQYHATLAASTQYPVIVKFSSPPEQEPSWPVNFSQQGTQPIVRGMFAAHVTMTLANPPPAQSDGAYVQVLNPMLNITSGTLEFAGTVEFATTKVHCSSGAISTTSKHEKTTYTDGTLCLLNDKTYLRNNGKWSAQ